MICQYVERHLLYYLLGELSPSQRARLEEHIPQCAVCSEELKALSRDVSLISESIATAAAAPDSLVLAIRRRVAEQPALRPARRAWLTTRVRPAHALGMLTVFAAVAVMTWFIYRPHAPAAPITHTALMRDRSAFVNNDGVRTLETGTPEEAARTLSERVDTEVAPVRIPCDGLRFRGYAQRAIAGCPVALLVYENENGDDCVSIYEYACKHCALGNRLRELKYRGRAYRAGSRNGTTTVAWVNGDTVIALVSDCPLSRALSRADTARESAKR